MVGNIHDALPATILFVMWALVIVHASLYPHCRSSSTCCYPRNEPIVHGSCDDPTSDVRKHINPVPCTPYCAYIEWPIVAAIYILLVRFRKTTDREYHRRATTRLRELAAAETDAAVSMRLVKGADEHRGMWFVYMLPDVVLFGYLADLAGFHALGSLQRMVGGLSIACGLLYGLAMRPLELAYSCYPSITPSTTKLGLCTNTSSPAYVKYHASTAVWWPAMGTLITLCTLLLVYLILTAKCVHLAAWQYTQNIVAITSSNSKARR